MMHSYHCCQFILFALIPLFRTRMRRLIVLVEASIQGYLLREGKRKASVASLCELRDHETDKAEGFVGPLLSLKEIKARILLYLLQQLYPQSEHTGTSGLLVVNKAKRTGHQACGCLSSGSMPMAKVGRFGSWIFLVSSLLAEANFETEGDAFLFFA